jgi:hypothetical protein
VRIIDRPAELSTDEALVEDVVVHGFAAVEAQVGAPLEMLVLLFCNAATITPGIIDRGIEALRANPDVHSAVTVSAYNEFSPVRAKRIDSEGLVVPYVDVDRIQGASCDRDSAETCYFCDCSVWIMRPSCKQIDAGVLPFRWMGARSLPLYQEGGLDIDHGYGIAMTEHWLRQNGFTESRTPYACVAAG